jgi:hypothetical protein
MPNAQLFRYNLPNVFPNADPLPSSGLAQGFQHIPCQVDRERLATRQRRRWPRLLADWRKVTHQARHLLRIYRGSNP